MIPETVAINPIDFIPGSTFFRWKEALYLPRWGVLAMPTKAQFEGIIKLATRLELARGRVAAPWTVTSWLRPKMYNIWPHPYGVKGAAASAHMDGLAIDFQVFGMKADEVRETLKPNLELYGLRMEDLPGSSWVHLDCREPVLGNRFFKP